MVNIMTPNLSKTLLSELHMHCILTDATPFSFFFFWPCPVACGILVPQPGIEPGPWQWNRQVLTTGPPGYSRYFIWERRNLGPKCRKLLAKCPRTSKCWGLHFTASLSPEQSTFLVNKPSIDEGDGSSWGDGKWKGHTTHPMGDGPIPTGGSGAHTNVPSSLCLRWECRPQLCSLSALFENLGIPLLTHLCWRGIVGDQGAF